MLGVVTHGLVLPDATRDLLWQPLYLSLGVTMALFVVGAVRDWRGDAAGRRMLTPMLVLAVVVLRRHAADRRRFPRVRGVRGGGAACSRWRVYVAARGAAAADAAPRRWPPRWP